MAKINVSIVTYLTPLDELEGCLDSLLASDAVASVDIVDNASEQRIARYVEQRGDSRLSYEASANVGYGAGHNKSIRRSLEGRGDEPAAYHLVMNSDVTFEPGVLERLLEAMESDSEVAHVIPGVVYPDGSHQVVARLLPTPFDLLLRRFLPESWFKKRRRRYLLTDGSETAPINAPYLLGSFMLLRVDALRRVGIFDERYFMYPEDIDLTRRLHRHYKTLYLPCATIVHTQRATSYHSLRMTLVHVFNMVRYFNKWGWLFDRERREFNRRVRQEMKS